MEAINKYQLGKVYKIVCNKTNKIYIGSTCMKYLRQRLAEHIQDYKKYKSGKKKLISSFEIIENEDYDIVLIENFPCNTKDELHMQERYHIENNECVNRVFPIVSKEEAKERLKQYREDNKEMLRQQKKEYYEQNKEVINMKQKQYYYEHIDEMHEKSKAYRETHKDEKAECDAKYYERNNEAIKANVHEYRQNNLEAVRAREKHYNDTHKEERKAYKKIYHKEHKDEIKEKRKLYYETNKDQIKLKQAETTTCECGDIITKCKLKRHQQTQKHAENMLKLQA